MFTRTNLSNLVSNGKGLISHHLFSLEVIILCEYVMFMFYRNAMYTHEFYKWYSSFRFLSMGHFVRIVKCLADQSSGVNKSLTRKVFFDLLRCHSGALLFPIVWFGQITLQLIVDIC